MNNLLNEYLRFNFELNIELNHFLARFNVKMNNQNVSLTPMLKLHNSEQVMRQTKNATIKQLILADCFVLMVMI